MTDSCGVNKKLYVTVLPKKLKMNHTIKKKKYNMFVSLLVVPESFGTSRTPITPYPRHCQSLLPPFPTRLTYTELCGGPEHLKMKTRLTDERFESVMGEYVFLK